MTSSIGKKIVIVPDTQIRKGVDLTHLSHISEHIISERPDIIVCLGDWWDCPSLSVYNSRLEGDGLRLADDLEAGWEGMDILISPIKEKSHKLKINKKKQWNPRLVFTVGNHDPQVRIPRLIGDNPVLEGYIEDDTTEKLKAMGWEVYDFGVPADVEGIKFSHYFTNPHSAKGAPVGGNIDTMIKNVGFSFVQGHNPLVKMGKHYLGDNTCRIGIVAGSCYTHYETYKGVQGNSHWRGIVQLNNCRNGGGDILEYSLEYLKHRYG